MKRIDIEMQTLYENVLATLLNESKVDTFARRLTQKVVNAAKKKMDDINKKRFLELTMRIPWPSFLKRQDWFSSPEGRLDRYHYFGPKAPSPFGPMEIKVKLSFIVVPANKSRRNHVTMEAGWTPALDTMEINVVIESLTGVLTPQHLSELQIRTYEIVRHELEHASQTAEKLMTGVKGNQALAGVPREVWTNPETVASYFLSASELEAFVAGMYHEAKRTRRPFIKIVDEKIELMMRMATAHGADAVNLRNVFMEIRYKWLEYAKKRFPKAITA